jgi:mono/diheme cytochrome c family protein
MMKIKLLLMAIAATFFLLVMAAAVMAQEEIPAPYSGLKNPFSWSDVPTQEAGEQAYRKSCLGCHGVDGGSVVESDFSAADFPQRLEEKQDFYYWILSEGAIEKGMPPYKSSYSEEKRWQVLTYMWSLGEVEEDVPGENTPPVQPPAEENNPIIKPPAEEVNDSLLLILPEQARSGQPLILTAYVRDGQEKPVGGATVNFFVRVDFFASGLMEIGEALTDKEGVAIFEYTPQRSGELEIVASYEDIETTTRVTLTNTDEPFYQPETGITRLTPGAEVFIGPESARGPGEGGTAPTSAFRLPGGILSWLLIVVVAVMLIWATYFRVMYQVFGIPIRREIRAQDTRIVPLIGLAIVAAVGTLLVLMLLTGPYSHFHLSG